MCIEVCIVDKKKVYELTELWSQDIENINSYV
jgi:hypothetical protein